MRPSNKKTPRPKAAHESGAMPTVNRITAHRRILSALEALRGAYQALLLDPPSPGAALDSIARARDVLAEVPAPYDEWTGPVATNTIDLDATMSGSQLRARILQLSTELLAVARQVTLDGTRRSQR